MRSRLLVAVGVLLLLMNIGLLVFSDIYHRADESRVVLAYFMFSTILGFALCFHKPLVTGFYRLNTTERIAVVAGAVYGNIGLILLRGYAFGEFLFWVGAFLAMIGAIMFIPIFSRKRS